MKFFLFLTACLSVLSASPVKAEIFTGSGFSLVDAVTGVGVGVASGNIVIAGDGRTLTSFNSVTINNLTHTWVGDLVVDLTHIESGTTVTLTSPPDNNSANFNGNYTFAVNAALQTIDEASAGLASAADLASGSYAISAYGGGTANGPRTSFDTLTGLPLDGTWRLRFTDFGVGDTGAVGSWSMDITAVPEPSSFGLLGSLLAVGFARKRKNKLALA